jgi:hypothetical protein
MIGLELNDAGLLAAGPDGVLVPLETGALASPGVALIEDGRLQVGLAAEQRCRRIPRQINRHFWRALASDPLQDPAYIGWTHADLAHAHLAHIWQQLAPAHEALLVAVPDGYSGHQLELLAGIMNALSIDVRAFVPLPLAALPQNTPAEILLHLDLSLHGTQLTVADLRREAVILDRAVIEGLGLESLRSAWMQVMADEFVRHTRFDPFHAADTEQILYDQLPGLLAALNTAEEVAVEMATPPAVHCIHLSREPMEQVLQPLMEAIGREIDGWQQAFFDRQPLETILVSQHAVGLPGFVRRLAAATGARLVPLAEGAAATGVLAFANAFPSRDTGRGVPFLDRKPHRERPPQAVVSPHDTQPDQQPAATHLLYRSRGYPLSARPLIVGREIPVDSAGIHNQANTAGVSRRHCTVTCRAGRLVLTDTSTYGTYVDGNKVSGETELTVGQTIRVGTPGETLQVIACLDNDETPTP